MELAVATNGGLFFLGSDRGPSFEGRAVTALCPAPDGVYAIVDGRELHAVYSEGSEEIARSDTRLNCVAAPGDMIWLGGAGARLFALEGREIEPVLSFDGAPGREEWYTPWGGPADVRSIALSNGNLYVNVHVGGILRSTDGGTSWVPTIDIHSDVHEVAAADDGSLVAASAWGLMTSGDDGGSWSTLNEGLHATYCRAVVESEGIVFVTASVGPHGGRSGLYMLTPGSDRLEKCRKGLPEWFGDNIDTGCLSAGDGRVAFGTSDGAVYASEDLGLTWDPQAQDLPPVRWLAAVR